MDKYQIHPGSLYDYTAGVYCGVLVKGRVMRRLAALQAKHLEDVKRVLMDGADRGEVFSSSWTLHYPDGEQTTVRFIDTDCEVSQRILTATTSAQPRHEPLVFIAGSMDEAKRMADAHYAESVQRAAPMTLADRMQEDDEYMQSLMDRDMGD